MRYFLAFAIVLSGLATEARARVFCEDFPRAAQSLYEEFERLLRKAESLTTEDECRFAREEMQPVFDKAISQISLFTHCTANGSVARNLATQLQKEFDSLYAACK